MEHENGVRHEAQAVALLVHDVMEQVREVHVQRHVQEELNIVELEQVVVVQYLHDTIRHDVMDHEINVHDRFSVAVEIIVQMELVMRVELQNIVVQERLAVVQQV